MIIVDSSALLAIFLDEPEREAFSIAILTADEALMSATNLVEIGMIIESRYGIGGASDLDSLIAKLKIEIVNFTETQASIARKAFRNYGKGKNPAGLSICDCYAYALAKDYDAPLLFKGNDFSKTDIKYVIN